MVIIGEAYRRKLRNIAGRLLPTMAEAERVEANELIERMDRDAGLDEAELVRLMRIMEPNEQMSGDSAFEEKAEKTKPALDGENAERAKDSDWMLREQMKIQMFSLLTHVRKMHMRRLKEMQREAMRRDVENRMGK